MTEAQYWSEQSKRLHWIGKPVIAVSEPAGQLTVRSGMLNICFNALDRQVALGRADETAVEAGSNSFSFAAMTEQTAHFAGALRAIGLIAGDRVLSYLPPSAECAIVLLACARIGVECVLVAEVTDPTALAEILVVSRPVVVVHRLDGYQPSIAQALQLSVHQPVRSVVVLPTSAVSDRASSTKSSTAASTAKPTRPEPVDLAEWELDFHRLMRSSAIHPAECAPVPTEAPFYTVAEALSTAAESSPSLVEITWSSVSTGEHALRLIAEGGSTDGVLWPSARIIGPLLAGRASQL
jgi:non-ribosomal peptide synthetase component F